MTLVVEIHESVIVLEGVLVVAAAQDDAVLLTEGDWSAVRLVESDGIVLAEMLLQKLFCDHKSVLLITWRRDCIHRVPAWFR